MEFLLGLFVFGAIFCLLLGVYAYATRSRLGELLRSRHDRDVVFSYFGRIGSTVLNRLTFFDLEKLEATLRLAGISLDAETFFGIAVSGIAGAFVFGVALWISGVLGPQVTAILPFLVWAGPRFHINRRADLNRAVLRINLMDFCARLEQAILGGANPERVFQWAAEGEGLLAQEIRFVVDARRYGKPLYQAFVEHFWENLEIPEAEEIGVILTNAAVRGISPVEPLKELNRSFRARRQMELFIRMSKLKPAVTTVLTLTALAACVFWIVAPLVLNIGKSFITSRGF